MIAHQVSVLSKEANNRAQRKWYAANKGTHKQRMEDWRAANPGHEVNYVRERRKTDLLYVLKNKLRTRLRQAVKRGSKSGSAVKDLGCSAEELRHHLELQFKLGMNWNNYGRGGWHIDHKIPLASFDLSDRTQLLQAVHFSNLQPLWEKENLSKGSKQI